MQTSFLSKMSDDKDASRELAPAIITEESQTRHPVYFFWKGANQFLLQGRVIIGPASETFFTYLFLLILALGTFIYYFIILPTLAQKFHLVFGFGFALCLVLFLIFYFLTATTEPGYLPHQNLLTCPAALNLESAANRDIFRVISGSPQGPGPANPQAPPSDEPKETHPRDEAAENAKEQARSDENNQHPGQGELVKKRVRPAQPGQPAAIDSEAIQARLSLQIEIQQLRQQSGAPVPDLVPKDAPPASPAKLEEPQNIKDGAELATQAATVEIENFKEARRFCLYCKIYKLEHTSHCVKCNSCVRVLSHHCMLVNNCIGKRNYKYFILLILFGFLMTVYFGASVVLFYACGGTQMSKIYRLLFFLTTFQAIIFFAFSSYYLGQFLINRGQRGRRNKGGSAVQDKSERNDFCAVSPSLVNFEGELDVYDARLVEE